MGGRGEPGGRGLARREGAGAEAGVGSSQATAGVRAVGALSATPGAGVGDEERKREQFEGRRGRDSGPTPSRAPLLNYL